MENEWVVRASCRISDPESLFAEGTAQNKAKTICSGCPVRTECLACALDNRIEYGVWGGMTDRERRALLRKRPDVPSWRQLLDSARTAHSQHHGLQSDGACCNTVS
ncbi:WhiB family transcriptional regulator [Streptomyces sp. NPDC095817]|uniref:WhiB family transcriptional regulator n=1 Tax=Streptomyces sp. NPDC095817 TaxID=3155082 RepID=UPI00331C8174